MPICDRSELERNVAHIVTVNQNAPAADVKETRNQVHQRALPSAARSHDRQHLSGFHFQIDAMQYGRRILAVVIGECDIVESNSSAKTFPYRFALGFSRTSSSMSMNRKISDDAPTAC